MAPVGDPTTLQIIYWAIAIVLALGTGIWKAAELRGKLNDNWAARVSIIETGLSDLAVSKLRDLRARIDEVLGAEDDIATSAIAEPAELLKSVKMFQKLIRTRRSVKSSFKWLLRIGNLLVFSFIFLIVGVIGGVLILSNVFEVAYEMEICWISVGIGIAGLVLSFSVYWALQNKLSGAEILSQSSDS